MTNIVITAGGTVEAIDGVRQISNTSTGGLCACIYEALVEFVGASSARAGKAAEINVHYIVAATAIRPKAHPHLPISFHPVTDVKSTELVLRELITQKKIHYVIHGMAVSDFSKGYLVERAALAEELTLAFEKVMHDGRSNWGHETLKNIVCRILEDPADKLNPNTKASSEKDLILSLVKTPKLIGKIKQWDPDIYLVGFKLLNGVPEEELLRIARGLSEKNGCDLVLANDLVNIGKDRHVGVLLKDGEVAGRYQTKMDIGRGVVEHMLAEWTPHCCLS